MTAPKITTILLENNKDESTYGVYQVDARGVCWEQELFSYREGRSARGEAYAKAQKQARDWAAAHAAKIETNW